MTALLQQLRTAVEQEKAFHSTGLNFLATDSIPSAEVSRYLGHPDLISRALEGTANARYHPGHQHVDEIETVAMKAAVRLFGARYANVQPLSGTIAEDCVLDALLRPGDTLLSLELAHGGHLTGGMPTHRTGKTFNIVTYGVTQDSNLLDYAQVEQALKQHKPKVVSYAPVSHVRQPNYPQLMHLAQEHGARLVVDVSHYAGLIAAGKMANPTQFADVVTLSCRKTLCGFGGIILWNDESLSMAINLSVFPGNQGAVPVSTLAAKAQACEEARSTKFVDLMERAKRNASALGQHLAEAGFRLITGGTDGHLLLADVTPLGINGSQATNALTAAGILVNKNLVPYDSGTPTQPSGIRLGTLYVTQLGLETADMEFVADLILDVVRHHADDGHLKSVYARIAKEVWNK